MKAGTLFKNFVFNNKADELYQLTIQVAGYVIQHANVDDCIVFKIKMVLIELLTNSLKHSGQAETLIRVSVSANEIVLHKTDTGNPLAINTGNINLKWPVSSAHAGNTIEIYDDMTCLLKGRILDSCRVEFFIEEHDILGNGTDLINNLTEHFGLLIIARACDRFEYRFDMKSETNSFIATFITKGSN